MAAYYQPDWASELIYWLRDQGYILRESGSYNPKAKRGWYSHPCEYQWNHVRVRINQGGVIILRDPGCTIQIERPIGHGMTEQISPNMNRLDYLLADIATMIRAITAFESRPAFTAMEARKYFFKEAI